MSDYYQNHEKELSDFVSREVIYCVSSLISDLVSMEDSEYYDDLLSICVQDDWETAALEYVSDLSRDECVDILTNIGIECYDNETDDTLQQAVYSNIEDGTIDAREFCDDNELDPDQNEVFEHWIVSEWLASRLADHGEMVSHDIHDLTVWGRTTTGQGIALDGVICEIHRELHERCDAA